jgi:hypothetical protein
MAEEVEFYLSTIQEESRFYCATKIKHFGSMETEVKRRVFLDSCTCKGMFLTANNVNADCPKLRKFHRFFDETCCPTCRTLNTGMLNHNRLDITVSREMAAFHLKNCLKSDPAPYVKKNEKWVLKAVVEKCVCNEGLKTAKNDEFELHFKNMMKPEQLTKNLFNAKQPIAYLRDSGCELKTDKEFCGTPWEDIRIEWKTLDKIVGDIALKWKRILKEASVREGYPRLKGSCLKTLALSKCPNLSEKVNRTLYMGFCTCNDERYDKFRALFPGACPKLDAFEVFETDDCTECFYIMAHMKVHNANKVIGTNRRLAAYHLENCITVPQFPYEIDVASGKFFVTVATPTVMCVCNIRRSNWNEKEYQLTQQKYILDLIKIPFINGRCVLEHPLLKLDVTDALVRHALMPFCSCNASEDMKSKSEGECVWMNVVDEKKFLSCCYRCTALRLHSKLHNANRKKMEEKSSKPLMRSMIVSFQHAKKKWDIDPK